MDNVMILKMFEEEEVNDLYENVGVTKVLATQLQFQIY